MTESLKKIDDYSWCDGRQYHIGIVLINLLQIRRPTVRIFLVLIMDETTVVVDVPNAIIVIIIITDITLAILVLVQLVGIWSSWTVILVILNTILIPGNIYLFIK
jgi:hypothetical protein